MGHEREVRRERLNLLTSLLEPVNPKGKLVGAEIGVWRGAIIVGLLTRVERIKTMYSIDPYQWDRIRGTKVKSQEDWDHEFANVVLSYRLAGIQDRVIIVRRWSEEAVEVIPELDFIHIDGNHDYEQVKRDILNYLPKIKHGGLMCGHDYDQYGLPGVKEAADEIAKERGFEIHSSGERAFTWWWYVP